MEGEERLSTPPGLACLVATNRGVLVPPGATQLTVTLWGRSCTARQRGTLQGYGQAEDIANAVEYLVTAAGRHVSGQILRVDGCDQTWPA